MYKIYNLKNGGTIEVHTPAHDNSLEVENVEEVEDTPTENELDIALALIENLEKELLRLYRKLELLREDYE